MQLKICCRFALLGFLAGLMFPIIATLVEIQLAGLSFSFSNFLEVQQKNPLLWIIDFAPFILSVMATIIGIKQNRLKLINQQQEQTIADRTQVLAQKNTHLEREILERKKIEQDLRKAKNSAEHAAKARSEFLSTMSHEIRTPLNAVIGLTGLLEDTPLNEEQADYVQTVRMSGEALLSIINDILDYSKIESGKLELEEQAFPLLDPIEDTFDLLATKANEKGLELISYLEEDVPLNILGDITRLRQILVNLVNNAIKFTENGEICIFVKRKFDIEGKVCLEFQVKDTGIGIPKDRLNRLLKSFSQVDASTTRKYGGTGLGLAICKRLVDLMKGEIWVESEWGSGTTFYFTIQVPVVEKMELPIYKSHTLTGKKVLIVDDNDTNLLILSQRCRKWGLEVVQFNHPLKALEYLDSPHQLDAAILDLNMPGMDGVSLAHAIRERFQQRLPLIMLSSGGAPESKKERALFESWLIKPARKKQLFQALMKSLQIRQETSNQEENSSSSIDMPKRHNRKLRILLAEDNKVNQKVALKMLDRLGYKADVAGNGIEAVTAVKMLPYDLVLMDMQMPEKDGLEATLEIRELEQQQTPKLIIIAMTANASTEDRENCFQAGMNDFLAKPVRLEDLDAAITKWFYLKEA